VVAYDMPEHGPPPGFRALERALGQPLEPPIEAQFERYLDLVLTANVRAGLTSLEDPNSIVERHFAESLALLALTRSHKWTEEALTGRPRLVDIGPGGGFPGVPMRLAEPRIHLTLLESSRRRATFLEELATELALPDVEVVRARAEEAGRMPELRGSFDLATARAVAPLPVLVEYAVPLLRPGGVLVTPKGSGAAQEIEAARSALEALGAQAADPVLLANAATEPAPTVVLVRRTSVVLDERYPRRPGMPSKRPLGG
jgi:16S rRNA (guanine527-N7)-methyltransferase